MTSKNRLTVNLTTNEFRELKALAEKHGVSMAWMGRKAIDRLLEEQSDQELQLPLEIDRLTGTSDR